MWKVKRTVKLNVSTQAKDGGRRTYQVTIRWSQGTASMMLSNADIQRFVLNGLRELKVKDVTQESLWVCE